MHPEIGRIRYSKEDDKRLFQRRLRVQGTSNVPELNSVIESPWISPAVVERTRIEKANKPKKSMVVSSCSSDDQKYFVEAF